jgi:hypothetical protein
VSDNLITRTADPMDRVKHDADDPNPCPPLNAAEYEALKRSIQDDGYIPAFPVVISAGPACDGQIIDGFHRSRVCAELGIEPIRIYHPCATELEFKILQIKANLERRQLSPAQRGILAVRLLPLYEERAKVRMVAGVADPVIPGSQGRAPRSVDQVAEAAGVSSATVTRMKAIMESEQADTLLDAITSQGKSVKAAYESLRPAKEQAALDTSISNENAAVVELEEHFSPAAETTSSARDRAAGDAVRLALELDAHVRRHNLTDQDILDYKSRPHTATGTFRRLADWVDLAASALELNR